MLKKYQAIFKLIAILIIVMIILKFCLIFLWPFLIAILFSTLLEPIVKMFCRLGLSRKFGVAVSFFIVMIIILIIGLYLSKYMYSQILSFSQNLSQILTVLSDKFIFLNNQKYNYTDLINTLEGVIISYRTKILHTIVSTVNGFVYLILIFMSTIFISIDLETFKKSMKKNLSMNTFEFLSNVLHKIGEMIKVEMELVFLTTLQTVIGFYILGINNALTIGIICGILDLLPIVGPTIIFIPLVIYEFLINQIFIGTGLIFLFVLLQISREIMKIKFVGHNFQIHPIVTILSLYVGVVLYGLWGIIFGPIIVILAIELFNQFYGRRSFFKL